jgi:hypothetical protein
MVAYIGPFPMQCIGAPESWLSDGSNEDTRSNPSQTASVIYGVRLRVRPGRYLTPLGSVQHCIPCIPPNIGLQFCVCFAFARRGEMWKASCRIFVSERWCACARHSYIRTPHRVVTSHLKIFYVSHHSHGLIFDVFTHCFWVLTAISNLFFQYPCKNTCADYYSQTKK